MSVFLFLMVIELAEDEQKLGQLGGQPLLILSEDSERQQGKDALNMNIQAGKVVGKTIKTTLGPKGMDKMLVDSMGDMVITNDGATILDEMDVEHPAAKMMVEVAESQDENAGDGTTTAVTLSGELLNKAENLLDQDVHASIITKGYRMAANQAQKILEDMAIEVDPEDKETLKKVAETSITGKNAENAKETLSELSINAINEVRENGEIDLDYIKMEKEEGGTIQESELVNGIILDEKKAHNEMPGKTENAEIALISDAIEVQETNTDAELNIENPDQLQSFLDQEEEMLKQKVEKIKEVGANVLICEDDIDDLAQHYLAKEGIQAIENVDSGDMEKLALATKGSVSTTVEDLTEEDLGKAGKVRQEKVGGNAMTFVEDCEEPKAVSILIRGGTEHVVDEVERSLEDSLKVIKGAIQTQKLLPGGGAPEIELSLKLKNYAKEVGGKEQLAIESFAEAMETIPKTLAETAGMDQINTMVKLRNKHKETEQAGISVQNKEISNMEDHGILEPLTVASQAVKSASDAATMILRIDDVVSTEGGNSGAPGGAPGAGAGGGVPGM